MFLGYLGQVPGLQGVNRWHIDSVSASNAFATAPDVSPLGPGRPSRALAGPRGQPVPIAHRTTAATGPTAGGVRHRW